MAKIKITIGNLEFRSKKQAMEYVRNFLRVMEKEAIVKPENPNFDFLYKLIERHHEFAEKTFPGVKSFLVKRNYLGNIELKIERIDGSFVDISWYYCVTGNISKKPGTFLKLVSKKPGTFLGTKRSLSQVCPECH